MQCGLISDQTKQSQTRRYIVSKDSSVVLYITLAFFGRDMAKDFKLRKWISWKDSDPIWSTRFYITW